MSKAFTKDDDAGEFPLLAPRRAPLPDGVPNYVTARGLQLLHAELAVAEAPEAASAASDAERSRGHALRAARIAELESRIASAVLVDNHRQPRDQVRFGAVVRVQNLAGSVRRYRIVGVDEADASRAALAFTSPLARALLGKRVGEVVELSTPGGEDELEVLGIDYE
jgi:transcription elongation factor GreB